MIRLEEIEQAKEQIKDIAKVTPVITSKQLNEKTGKQIYLKGEHLQKTGSFKIRGATNKLMNLAEAGVKQVVAASSGNHGQAVAYVANELGMAATIVVPEDASQAKINAITSYGGKVIKHGRTSSERIDYAKKLEGEFIPPYDDRQIIAGQGTVGLEIMCQVRRADTILVPVGGGGLLAGVLLAVKKWNPTIQVIAVEPEIANDTYLSLAAGHWKNIGQTTTIADGLRTSEPGALTFPIVQEYVDDIILVSEAEIKEAMIFSYERLKQVIEPSGAVTLAACLAGKLPQTAEKVVSLLSGGNFDLTSSENVHLFMSS